MDLTEFLLARIAEDEWGIRQVEKRMQDAGRVDLWFGRPVVPYVLAECEAKRRIVEYLGVILAGGPDDSWRREDAVITLQCLARPYADHLNYDPTWHA